MARLTRNDLAKEFDEIVKQEIKNHNNSILATNQCINDFRQQFISLREECAYKNAEIASLLGSFSDHLSDMEENIRKEMSDAFRKLKDAQDANQREMDMLKASMAIKESYFLRHSDFEQFRVKMDEWIAQIQRLFHIQNSQLSQDIHKSREAHVPTCNELEKKLTKRLCDEIEEIEKLHQSMDSFSLNFDGLKQEIERMKKRCFILEKNIENIYIQIERMKVELCPKQV